MAKYSVPKPASPETTEGAEGSDVAKSEGGGAPEKERGISSQSLARETRARVYARK